MLRRFASFEQARRGEDEAKDTEIMKSDADFLLRWDGTYVNLSVFLEISISIMRTTNMTYISLAASNLDSRVSSGRVCPHSAENPPVAQLLAGKQYTTVTPLRAQHPLRAHRVTMCLIWPL